MKKTTIDTVDTVIFRKNSYGIFAIFPYIIADMCGSVTIYQHVGQHSAGTYDHCIASSKAATAKEYGGLKNELESIGYNLKIGEKRHWNTYVKALRIVQNY